MLKRLAHKHWIKALLGFALCFGALGCIETAECDKNNPCPTGELCFRKFCSKECTSALEDISVQRAECSSSLGFDPADEESDVICTECEGECAGESGQVCVRGSVCEPVCACGAECCVEGHCIDQ